MTKGIIMFTHKLKPSSSSIFKQIGQTYDKFPSLPYALSQLKEIDKDHILWVEFYLNGVPVGYALIRLHKPGKSYNNDEVELDNIGREVAREISKKHKGNKRLVDYIDSILGTEIQANQPREGGGFTSEF